MMYSGGNCGLTTLQLLLQLVLSKRALFTTVDKDWSNSNDDDH
jgi:hypothetical protein